MERKEAIQRLKSLHKDYMIKISNKDVQFLISIVERVDVEKIERIILNWRGHSQELNRECDCLDCRKGGNITKLTQAITQYLEGDTK